jgi:hypothetical protein
MEATFDYAEARRTHCGVDGAKRNRKASVAEKPAPEVEEDADEARIQREINIR